MGHVLTVCGHWRHVVRSSHISTAKYAGEHTNVLSLNFWSGFARQIFSDLSTVLGLRERNAQTFISSVELTRPSPSVEDLPLESVLYSLHSKIVPLVEKI